jgi:hypothetical protein
MGLGIAALLACAKPGPPPESERTSLPLLGDGDTSAELGYEQPPLQRAAEVLPDDLRAGPHHQVSDPVPTDGFLRSYTLESDYGVFEAQGDDMLAARVAEIHALAQLEELSATQEFASALGQTLKSPFVAAWKLVSRPVRSSTGVPRGADDELRRSAELPPDERGELDDDALGEFSGFGRRKREIAHRLAVDPYSSNELLQARLNRFAWVSTIGGFGSAQVPFAQQPGRAGSRSSFGVEREDQLLLDHSPEDLRRLNLIELAVMGIPDPLRRSFVAHPWYSPRLQSRLVAHLTALDLVENRAAFVEAALSAGSEVDARLYVRTAELLRAYHTEAAPLERIATFRATVVGVTAESGLVAPMALDYAVWTRPMHAFANTLLRSSLSDGRSVSRREILVTGSFSPKARAKIRQRNIEVTERALGGLAAATPGDED